MKKWAVVATAAILLLATTPYAGALFFGSTPMLLLPLGLGFWLQHLAKPATALRWEMHARTKANGLRSYPAPNWVYGGFVVALIVLVAIPLFGRFVFDRLGLEPVPTLVTSWGLFLLLMGGMLVLLMKEISLVYAHVASLDAGEAATG